MEKSKRNSSSGKKNVSLHCKVQDGAVGGPANCLLTSDVEKLTVKTKNGLVNGVVGDKCKTKSTKNKTKVSKVDGTAVEGNLNVQSNDLDLANLNTLLTSTKKKKQNQQTKNGTKELPNAISERKADITNSQYISQSSDSLNKNKPNTSKKYAKTNQSKFETVNHITESKASKNNKHKNKTDSCPEPIKPDCNLLSESAPKSSTLSELLPLTPQAGSSGQNFPLEDLNQDFEKDLIESLKHFKIDVDDVASRKEENVSQIDNTEPNASQVEEPKIELPPIDYVQYESELQMPMIMKIIQKDLSEPYSIYTYRYFIHNWPKLCFLAMCEEKCVGAIVCKLDLHRKIIKRGYIAMLAVDEKYRKRSIGSTLVRRAIQEMIDGGADEVVLETEVTNKPALRLYEQLGFVRDKRLFRYYLNGVDALRLKLWLR